LRIIWGISVPDFRDPHSLGRLKVNISEALLRTVFDVILSAWPSVVAAQTVTPQCKEDEITDKLYDEMYAEKHRRKLDNIDFEREPQSNLVHDPLPLGYIDVKVSYNNWRRTDYFVIECKRVSATQQTPAKKYVDDGVVRFVSEKYSSGHPWGGMIAYVIDGDETPCALLLERTLASHNTTATNTRRPWARETRFSNYPHCYSSDHQQQTCGKIITLLHILLAFPQR
jgi:hypothetical protein